MAIKTRRFCSLGLRLLPFPFALLIKIRKKSGIGIFSFGNFFFFFLEDDSAGAQRR